MRSLDADLQTRLTALHDQALFRSLRRVDSPQGTRIHLDGKPVLNFASNDYLGLANHPALREAGMKAIRDVGAGSGASRLLCGSLAPFHELEERLAAFKGTEAALVFATGYATALGTLPALMEKGDILILDKLVHACLVDGARLSGAKLRVFAHNDLDDLEAKLRWAREQMAGPAARRRIMVVTESVFSMDGDNAPLAEITALKERYGAWLMVDEAHATGLYGTNRRGLAEELGVTGRIEIQMGTLGKALGASGGYICGSRTLIDFLVNRARSLIFSTAPVPAAAAIATTAIHLVQSKEGEQRNARLWRHLHRLHSAFRIPRSAFKSAILPVRIGDEKEALSAAAGLLAQGVFVPAIRFPTVARGTARLRITLSAAHSEAEVDRLATGVASIVNPQAAIAHASSCQA